MAGQRNYYDPQGEMPTIAWAMVMSATRLSISDGQSPQTYIQYPDTKGFDIQIKGFPHSILLRLAGWRLPDNTTYGVAFEVKLNRETTNTILKADFCDSGGSASIRLTPQWQKVGFVTAVNAHTSRHISQHTEWMDFELASGGGIQIGDTISIRNLTVVKGGTIPTLDEGQPDAPETLIKGMITLINVRDGQDGARGADGRNGEKGDKGDRGEKGEKGERGEQGIQGIQGLQGARGEQGIQGVRGADGRNGTSSYTHIAYADTATGGGFSQQPANKSYIGIYVDSNPTDSANPTSYKWSLIKGAQGAKGDQGVAGAKGADGRTPYLHIAYASSADGRANFSVGDPTGRTYIGTYTDYTSADSTNPASYKWSLIKGADGRDGVGVADVTKEYCLSDSKDTAPRTGWTTQQPAWEKGKYLWTRECYTLSDDDELYTTPTCSSEWEAVNLLGDGRNLFGYRRGIAFEGWGYFGSGWDVALEKKPEVGGVDFVFSAVAEGGAGRSIAARFTRLGFGVAGWYTFSCEIKCQRAGVTTKTWPKGLWINICHTPSERVQLTTEWQRVVITSNVTLYYGEDYGGFVELNFDKGHGMEVGDIISMRNIMIERGATPTAYKVAEEDLKWDIDNAAYLQKLLQQDVNIKGGVVMAGALHAAEDGTVRSFINGVQGKPAFAAGVTNYGQTTEAYATAFEFDGSGHIGELCFGHQGGVPRMYIVGDDGQERVTFSKGDLPTIAMLQGGTAPSVEIPQQSPSLDFTSSSRSSQGVSREWRSSTIAVNVVHGVLTMRGTLAVRVTGYDDSLGREDNVEVSSSGRGTTFVGGASSSYYAHVRLELWQGSSVYKVIEEYIGGLTGQSMESADRPINLTIHDLPTGNYSLRLSCYSERTARATATFTMSEKLLVDFKKVDKRTHVAGNGIASFFDRDQWVYIANGILQACGKTNLPGVLFSGKLGKDSQVTYLWGIDGTSVFIQRHGIGSVRIYHNLNRLDYTVQLTIEEEWGNNPSNRPLPRIINVMEKNANNFLVYIREYNGKMVDENFHFAVFGRNR